MDYNALETEIAARLNAYFAATPKVTGSLVMLSTLFKAREMPEDDEDFTRVNEKAIVNIDYTTSLFKEPSGTSQIQQKETVVVSFYVQAPNLKKENGARNLIKHVIKCMLGYRPENSRNRIYISNYVNWEGLMDDEIKPTLEMSFDTVLQQEKEAEESFGTLSNAEII